MNKRTKIQLKEIYLADKMYNKKYGEFYHRKLFLTLYTFVFKVKNSYIKLVLMQDTNSKLRSIKYVLSTE